MPDADSGKNWELHESGPADARHTVFLLPGALCSAAFLDDLIAQPKLNGLRLVTTTLPGNAGRPPPADYSMEAYARDAAKLAAEHGADVVVGHSLGANVAIEMVGAGAFSGPLVLLAPSFSRKDESIFPRILDRLGSVLGHLPFALAFKGISGVLKGEVPDDRLDALTADLKTNDPRAVRRHLHHYLKYLDRYGSVVPRLCDSGVYAWVVFGENDDVTLEDEERNELDACPRVTLVTIPDTGHFTPNTHPTQIAELIVEAVSASSATA